MIDPMLSWIQSVFGLMSDSPTAIATQMRIQPDPEEEHYLQDIYLPLNHLFSSTSKRALSRKYNGLDQRSKHEEDGTKRLMVCRKLDVPLRLDGSEDQITEVLERVVYFGASSKGEKGIYDAAKRVADCINSYSERGFITGSFKRAELVLFKVKTEPHELSRYHLHSWVVLTDKGWEEYLKEVKLREGGLKSTPK